MPLTITPNFANNFKLYEGKRKTYWIQEQLSNTYTIDMQIGQQGMIRRIKKSIKQNSNQSYSEKASDTKTQKYFETPNGYIKNKTRANKCLLLNKQKEGFNLWDSV